MRGWLRSLAVAVTALVAVLALGWSPQLSTVVRLLGTTAFVMGGTGHPMVNRNGSPPNYPYSEPEVAEYYLPHARDMYIVPAGGGNDDDYHMAVAWTPEEFFPVAGRMTFDESVAIGFANLSNCVAGDDDCIAHYETNPVPGDDSAVFGYSQSARIATILKRVLIAGYDSDGPHPVKVMFVVIGNPNRASGGILQRFKGLVIPILVVTFDGATPTNGPVDDNGHFLFPTVDVTRQYDGWSDFPLYPLNVVSLANAVAGILYQHGDYFGAPDRPLGPLYDQGTTGDTSYYMFGTERLPILQPLADLGVPSPILTALDAPLRVLVEWGYDRDIAPGTPTTARLLRLKNPLRDLVNLLVAIPTGLDDAIAEATGDPTNRPFGTTPVQSPFGVGGPVLDEVDHPVAPVGPPMTLAAPDRTPPETTVGDSPAPVPAAGRASAPQLTMARPMNLASPFGNEQLQPTALLAPALGTHETRAAEGAGGPQPGPEPAGAPLGADPSAELNDPPATATPAVQNPPPVAPAAAPHVERPTAVAPEENTRGPFPRLRPVSPERRPLSTVGASKYQRPQVDQDEVKLKEPAQAPQVRQRGNEATAPGESRAQQPQRVRSGPQNSFGPQSTGPGRGSPSSNDLSAPDGEPDRTEHRDRGDNVA